LFYVPLSSDIENSFYIFTLQSLLAVQDMSWLSTSLLVWYLELLVWSEPSNMHVAEE